MSTQTLTELPRIQQRGMDFDTVISEIRDILANNPNWAENWPEFYDSEAGVMLTQLMAWVMDNMSTKQDVLLNEMFLSTAQDDDNKMKLLKQIAYNPRLASSAKVQVSIDFNTTPTSFVYITKPRGSISNRINEICKFNSNDINGNNINWEILQISEDGKPDYLDAVVLKAGSTSYSTDKNNKNIYALQGETKYKEFTTETSDGAYFDLDDDNIAADSVRVYVTKTMKQLMEVTSFVSKDSLDRTQPFPYVVETNKDRTLRIRFGNKGILTSDRLLPAGTTISVFYRVTDGSVGNINPGFINSSNTFTDDNGNTWTGTIKNNLLANGGADSETLDQAVLNGPLTLRTMDRAVTPSDYNIILDKNPNIFKSKTYTSTNQPDDFVNYYGRYINPQEAFSVVLLNKNYKDVPASQYNNFPWITLTKEPRLNERYVFDKGSYDDSVSISPTYYNLSVMQRDTSIKTFKNATVFKLSSDFVNSMYVNGDDNNENQLLKLKLSTSKTEENFFDDIKFDLIYPHENDYFYAKNAVLTMNNNYLAADDNARFITSGSFSASEPINVNKGRYITVSFDNKKPITIDLWADRGQVEQDDGTVAYPDDDYYLLWTNTGDLNAKTTWGTNKTKVAASHRNGIVEIINEHLVQLETGDGGEFEEYTSNTSYQYFGLNMNGETAPIVSININNNYKLTLSVNETLYTFNFNNDNWKRCYESLGLTPDVVNYSWSCTKGLAMMLNYVFKSNGCDLKVYNQETNSFVEVEGFPLAELNASSVETTIFDTDYDNDDDTSFKSVYISNDLVIKTNSLTKASVTYVDSEGTTHKLKNVLWLDDVYKTGYSGFIHTVKGTVDNSKSVRDLIVEPTQGADYRNLAKFELVSDDSDMGYFKLTSPIKGNASSIHFKYESNSSDFMKSVLNLHFNNAGYSYKAYGVKRVYLMKSNALRVYITQDQVETSIGEDTVLAGSVIFENSCIYNGYDFDTVYANFKSAKNSSLVLGSVYNNFYYSGDSATDELIKRDVAGIEGQYIGYNILANGVKSYFIDENKTDLDIRFTSKKVDTNSLYSIKEDLDIIKSDRVKLLTASITEKVGGFLSLTIDDEDLSVDLTNAKNGQAVTNAIIKSIRNLSADSEVYKNRNTIARDSYTCLNQVQLQSLRKNNGKITFNYPGTSEIETVKHTMKTILGTNKTNADLYDLYPQELFDTDNIVYIDDTEYFYCPTMDKPITFKYRKMVEQLEDDGSITMVSREADYYITIEGAANGDQKSYRFAINKTENSRFPDSYFYVHFINDRTYDFDETGKVMETDEVELQSYMDKYKISGTDITFVKPYFKTYDIAATIKYNANFSEPEVVANVNKAVDEVCGLKNSEIAGSISRAKILKSIMNVDGVEDCKITYFGYNYANKEGNTDTLTTDFYEILCLNDSDGSTTGKIFTFEML